jgi:amidase
MVPVAHGNDGGGSIRIPAACCGLVGLKPARGRVSVGPDSGESFLVCDGVLTRTVGDTVALLDVLAGYEPGDATWAPPPVAPFGHLVASDLPRLRIGVALAPALESATPDPVCLQAARDAAALLQSLGHHVEEIDPPWAASGLLEDFTRAFGPQTALGVWLGTKLAGRDPAPEDVEPLTWAMWERANEHTSIDLLASQVKLEGLARRIVAFLAPYDLVVTPALAARPVPIGEIHGKGPDPMEHYRRSGAFTPYTAIVNVTGLPAISVPLYHGDDGLPLGVQLIGPPAREEVVLQVAAALERERPWADRRPPL